MISRKCVDCLTPASKGICDACAAERRRLFALRHADKAAEPEAHRIGHELRVELYAAVVGAGGRIFEPGRQPPKG